MGYLKIDNLYRRADILQCYALEKVHGTSAHIAYKAGQVKYSASGESHAAFIACLPVGPDELAGLCAASFAVGQEVFVYGEAFGGKCQGMGDVYGDALRFAAFDVKVDGAWLDVPAAEAAARGLKLEFVPYERGPLALEWLDEQRDRPSRVAVVPDARSEGIVVRSIHEYTDNDGGRMIFKHKADDFRETRSPRQVDPGQLAILTEAGEIADEWVVPMRLQHVLQKVPYNDPRDTGAVVRAMVEDVRLESDGEVAWSQDVEKAIGRATARLLRRMTAR